MRYLLSLFATLILAMSAAGQDAPENSDEITDRPVVVAMFFSGFCGACQILDPRIESVEDEFAQRPVTFITFDKTFSAFGGRKSRAELAADHGMAEIWEQNKGKQGFALIVDPARSQVLNVITVRDKADDIRSSIERALRPETLA